MSSIVCHIRFTPEVLAKIIDGMEKYNITPPSHINEILRTATQAGLAAMLGPNWEHTPATPASIDRVLALTKQGAKTTSPATQITQALFEGPTTKAPDTPNIWEKFNLDEALAHLDPSDHQAARSIHAMMAEGHITPEEQLATGGEISRTASALLMSHKHLFPEISGIIEITYRQYPQEK
jgi:hypothetical protein